jgi:rod shape-determining protein MreC
MRILHEWFVHRKDPLTLFASVVLSLILISSNNEEQLQIVRGWTLAGFGFVFEKWSDLQRLGDVYIENEQLRKKNSELMLENSRIREAYLENRRLRDLLAFKSESRHELVAAKVIGLRNDGFINSVILAAGEADSVKKNMPIVTAQGLVGKVYTVAKGHSVSQLLLDRNFRVSAKIQRSRVTGIVSWSEGNRVVLAEVPKRSDVKVGDTVISSGFSTIFPEGLEIGQVSEIDEDTDGMFMRILVHPAVDFTSLEEVFIIRNQPIQTS